jgi:hypothetical protein
MFIRIRTINGRQYRYLQWSVREGKRVRTKSIYLGPVLGVGGLIAANFKVEPGSVHWERMIEQAQQWASATRQDRARDRPAVDGGAAPKESDAALSSEDEAP